MALSFSPCYLCKGTGKVRINVNHCKMKEDRIEKCPLCEGRRVLAIRNTFGFFQNKRMKPLDGWPN